MAVIVENGTGIASANAYVSPAYVTAYLTDRNRATENGWTSPEGVEESAAVVEATDFIEARFRARFGGVKEYSDVSMARATLALAAVPTANDTVTIGAQVYTFVASPSSAGDVLIGDTVADTISNLVAAILATPSLEGSSFGTGTVANVGASAWSFFDDQVLVYAKATGTAGNAVATTSSLTAAASGFNFATLVGGSNLSKPQPLSFPRRGLVDRDGNRVYGIPERLKWATAEYAVRARATSTTLAPDPLVDAYGGTITSLREKVGPLETATTYLPGSTVGTTLPVYPAADRLLAEFLRSGGVIRG